MSLKIDITDNTKIALKELKVKTEDAYKVIGNAIVNNAIDEVTYTNIVDTGRLRASLSYLTPEYTSGLNTTKVPNNESSDALSGNVNKLYVGTNVEYASYVHDGTSKMIGRPFLKIAIENTNVEKEIRRVFGDGN